SGGRSHRRFRPFLFFGLISSRFCHVIDRCLIWFADKNASWFVFCCGLRGGVGGRMEGMFCGGQDKERRPGLLGWMFWVNNRLAVVAPRARGGVGGERMVCFALGRRVSVSSLRYVRGWAA
ncbi:unnamed protein product, partial [Laminaria digitata]